DVTARLEKLLNKRSENDPEVPGLKSLLDSVQSLTKRLESGQDFLNVALSAKAMAGQLESASRKLGDSKLKDLVQDTLRDANDLEKAATLAIHDPGVAKDGDILTALARKGRALDKEALKRADHQVSGRVEKFLSLDPRSQLESGKVMLSDMLGDLTDHLRDKKRDLKDEGNDTTV